MSSSSAFACPVTIFHDQSGLEESPVADFLKRWNSALESDIELRHAEISYIEIEDQAELEKAAHRSIPDLQVDAVLVFLRKISTRMNADASARPTLEAIQFEFLSRYISFYDRVDVTSSSRPLQRFFRVRENNVFYLSSSVSHRDTRRLVSLNKVMVPIHLESTEPVTAIDGDRKITVQLETPIQLPHHTLWPVRVLKMEGFK